MNASTIRDRIANKVYEAKLEYVSSRHRFREGHVFDENQSVKWNKEEEVIRKNAEIDAQMKAYEDAVSQGAVDFKEDIIAYVIENFSINGNRDIAKKIFSEAYEEGHSAGYYEILNYVIDYADFAEEVLKLNK